MLSILQSEISQTQSTSSGAVGGGNSSRTEPGDDLCTYCKDGVGSVGGEVMGWAVWVGCDGAGRVGVGWAVAYVFFGVCSGPTYLPYVS